MGLSERERHEVLERLSALEAKAHSHAATPPPPPSDDKDMLARLARLQAEANVRRRG